MDDLMRDYISAVSAAILALRNEFKCHDLLTAWHSKQIPQRGKLIDGTSFQFHGIGCVVERIDGTDINFDFGDDQIVGFDAWRLWLFAKQCPDLYPNWQNKGAVEKMVTKLLELGLVRAGQLGDKLLYSQK